MNALYKKLAAYGLGGAIALSGAFLVAPFEGKENKVYVDPVGILTSCYGHTGNELKKGQVFTDEQCLDQLAEDLLEHDKKMLRYVYVPLSEEEHAAYLSFTYNVGVGAFKNSTLLKKLNAGDRVGACNELTRWNKAGGKVLNGLTKRRQAEREMCLKGTQQ
ncbi:lysozyme [Streptomyces sp. G35A]